MQRTRAAIGYVAFAYARAHHLSDVALPCRDGAVVRANRASFDAAVAAAHWRTAADLEQDLVDEPGSGSWPLVGASFVLMPADGETARRVGRFFAWALGSGAAVADDLGYVALPADAATLVRDRLLRP